MKSFSQPVLFDCYIHSALKDSAPDFFHQLGESLQSWGIPFEVRHFLTGEREHVLICAAETYTSSQGKKENLVIVPTHGEKREDLRTKKKILWLPVTESLQLLHQFLIDLNSTLLKRKTNECKEKMDKTLDLIKEPKSELKQFSSRIEFQSRMKALEDLLTKKLKLKQFSILNTADLYTNKADHLDYLLPLWEEDEYLAFSGKLGSKEISALVQFLKESWEEKENLLTHPDLSKEEMILEVAFKTLSLPMALISSTGDILLHNPSFVKLSLTPDQCLAFNDDAKILLPYGETYKLIKKRVDSEGSYYFLAFQAATQFGQKANPNSNSEELGIISSSIAHELNNPLAGIMAAIGLLALDDNWSAEARNDLEEMKRGSARCKALVETFLGFSRMNPQHTSRGSFEQALEQALNLIRFRLVENNMKLSFQKELSGSQSVINNSIFSMVLYLIFGELITAFSHHLLVSKNAELSKLIEGKVFQEKIAGKDSLVIRIQSAFDFEDSIRNSKLIKHLLELENHKLQVDNKQIIIFS
ncbi:MAG: histidine kinase dimerization/phospho-acceptor domain-containing protein [Bacteriovoracaceae bacterium]